MRKISAIVGLLLALLAIGAPANAQCPPNQSPPLVGGGNVFGAIVSQWKQYFTAKVDATNGCSTGQNLVNPVINGLAPPWIAAPNNTIMGNNSGDTAAPFPLSPAQVNTMLGGPPPQVTTAPAHQFFNNYPALGGTFSAAQPAFTDLSGSISPGQVPWGIIGSNLMYNSAFDLDQRNEGGVYAIAGGGGGTFEAAMDFFDIHYFGPCTGLTLQRVSANPLAGFPFNAQITCGTGGVSTNSDHLTFEYKFLGDDISQLGYGTPDALPTTFSWNQRCTANAAGDYGVSYVQDPAGGRSYTTTITVPNDAAWHTYSVTVPGDTGSGWVISGIGQAMEIDITLDAGSAFQTSPSSIYPQNTWNPAEKFAPPTQVRFSSITGAACQFDGWNFVIGSVPGNYFRLPAYDVLLEGQKRYAKSYTYGVVPGTAGITQGVRNFQGPVVNIGGSNVAASIYFDLRRNMQCVPGVTGATALTSYSGFSGTSGKARDYTNGADITPVAQFVGDNSAVFAVFPSVAPSTNGTVAGNMGALWVADCAPF